MKRHQVQVLLGAGHTKLEVARLAGVSLKTVKRIAKESPPEDDPSERKKRAIGRPSVAEPFRAFVAKQLEAEPHLLAVELLRRARLEGYRGGHTALYALVASIRTAPPKLMVRFEGLPGEFTQHDFGEVIVCYADESTERVHFLASRLKYSRLVAVSLVPNQQTETLVRGLADHFEGFGGVPLLAVFDRPKTIAMEWNHAGEVTKWNSAFCEAMLDLGVGVELCWPHSPRQKGAVENLVGWVKGSFFKQRRFHDREDLERQLREWLVEVNTLRPNRATREIPSARYEQERPRLRELRIAAADLAVRVPIYVGPTGFVTHDAMLYSMPADSIGMAGTMFLYKDRVRIAVGQYEAEHPRLMEKGKRSLLPQHRDEAVARVSGKRGRRYLKREMLLETGQSAFDYLTELIHRRPRIWLDDVDRLFELLQVHGGESLSLAFTRGLADSLFGAEYIANYLRPNVSLLGQAIASKQTPSSPPPVSFGGKHLTGRHDRKAMDRSLEVIR